MPNLTLTLPTLVLLLSLVSAQETPEAPELVFNTTSLPVSTTSLPFGTTSFPFNCNACPVNLRSGICASDGKVYGNLCRARCAAVNNTELFTCGFNEGAACTQRCQAAVRNTNCESRCPVYFVKQSVCGSDGNLYMDECRAKCANTRNYQVFACNNLSDTECAAKCKSEGERVKCESTCPQYIRETLGCASDGNLYIDECRAKCTNSRLTLLFDCGYPVNSTTCKTRCTAAVNSNDNKCPQCRNEPNKPVCGSDGNTYNNKCLAGCIAGEAVYELEGANNNAAKDACKNYQSTVACQKRCSTRDSTAVCANDGYVYGNSCIARCGRLNVVNNCGRDIAACFRSCNGRN